MGAQVRDYVYRDPPSRAEGVRIGCTRYPPLRIRKKDYKRLNYMDVWLPLLAPSRSLLRWAAKRNRLEDTSDWNEFVRRYKREMSQTNARQTIRVLASLAKRTPISVGCFCDTKKCHAAILTKLIRAAAAGRF